MPHRPAPALIALLLAATVSLAGCTEDGDPGAAAPATGAGHGRAGRSHVPRRHPTALRTRDGRTGPADAPTSIRASDDVAGPGALDFGVLVDPTGPLAYLEPATLAATELAVDDVNAAGGVLGAPVTLSIGVIGDDGDAPAAARRLLDTGIDVLLGPVSEAASLDILDQVTAAGVVLISAHNDAPVFSQQEDRGLYVRTAPPDVLQGRALARVIADDGADTVAMLVREGPYAEPLATGVRDEAARVGLTVATSRAYDPEATDSDLSADVRAVLADRPDAVAVIGLAESARLIDALAAAGAGPSQLPVYGVAGNLGDRLGDAMAEPSTLGCMRGVLPGAPATTDFRRRLLRHDPSLVDLSDAPESYDAVVIAALATELAGTDDGPTIGAQIEGVTGGGTPCTTPADCLALLHQPAVSTTPSGRLLADIVYDGVGGSYQLSPAGDPTAATFRVVQFDSGGHLHVVGALRVDSR